MKKEMSNPEGLPIPKFSTDERTNKDSYYFDNNQLIDELDRKIAELETFKVKSVKKLSLFDVVTAVGLTVLIIHLILKF